MNIKTYIYLEFNCMYSFVYFLHFLSYCEHHMILHTLKGIFPPYVL